MPSIPLSDACRVQLYRLRQTLSDFDPSASRDPAVLLADTSFYDSRTRSRWQGSDPRGRLAEVPAPIAGFIGHIAWQGSLFHPTTGPFEFSQASEGYDLGDRLFYVIGVTESQYFLGFNLLDAADDPEVWYFDHTPIEPRSLGPLSRFLAEVSRSTPHAPPATGSAPAHGASLDPGILDAARAGDRAPLRAWLFERTGAEICADVEEALFDPLPSGPIVWNSLEQALGLHTWRSLFGREDDSYLPILVLGHTDAGITLYVRIDSPEVWALHHDATLDEVASRVFAECATQEEFLDLFTDRASLFSIGQLRYVLAQPTPEGRVRATRAMKGWSPQDLERWRRNPRFEFLRPSFGDWFHGSRWPEELADPGFQPAYPAMLVCADDFPGVDGVTYQGAPLSPAARRYTCIIGRKADNRRLMGMIPDAPDEPDERTVLDFIMQRIDPQRAGDLLCWTRMHMPEPQTVNYSVRALPYDTAKAILVNHPEVLIPSPELLIRK